MDGLLTRKITPASPAGGGVTSASMRKSSHVTSSSNALKPGAPPVGVVRSFPSCAHHPPPTHDQPLVSLSSKLNVNDFAVGPAGLPRTGKSVRRRSCEPNGTSVISSSGSVELTGLGGGSNATTPFHAKPH